MCVCVCFIPVSAPCGAFLLCTTLSLSAISQTWIHSQHFRAITIKVSIIIFPGWLHFTMKFSSLHSAHKKTTIITLNTSKTQNSRKIQWWNQLMMGHVLSMEHYIGDTIHFAFHAISLHCCDVFLCARWHFSWVYQTHSLIEFYQKNKAIQNLSALNTRKTVIGDDGVGGGWHRDALKMKKWHETES